MPLCAAAEEPEAPLPSSSNPQVIEEPRCTAAVEVPKDEPTAPTPASEEKPPKEEVGGKARSRKIKKKLIIPPGHEILIIQKKVNIFDTEVIKQISWPHDAEDLKKETVEEEQEKRDLEDRQRTLLELKGANSNWKEPEEPKHRRQVKDNRVLLDSSKAHEQINPPEGWGDHPYLDPDVQEVPKKRGRKPKEAKEDVVEEPKKGKTTKKSAVPSPPQGPERSSPEKKQRKEKELKQSKVDEAGKEVAAAAKAKARAAKKPSEAKSPDEPEIAGGVKKRGRGKKAEDAQPEEPNPKQQKPNETAKERKRKATQNCDDPELEGESHKGGKTAPAEEAEMSEKEKVALEKKARLSRKSAAYHHAYRHTEGSLQDKKAAAKQAFWLHVGCYLKAVSTKAYAQAV